MEVLRVKQYLGVLNYIDNVTISIIGGVQTQRLLEFTKVVVYWLGFN